MSLPTRLRDYYDKVVTPAADSGIHKTVFDIYIEMKYLGNTHFKFTKKNLNDVLGPSGGVIGLAASAGASRSHSRLTGGAVQHMVQAYSTMNRFLARFLEHVGGILCNIPSSNKQYHFYIDCMDALPYLLFIAIGPS